MLKNGQNVCSIRLKNILKLSGSELIWEVAKVLICVALNLLNCLRRTFVLNLTLILDGSFAVSKYKFRGWGKGVLKGVDGLKLTAVDPLPQPFLTRNAFRYFNHLDFGFTLNFGFVAVAVRTGKLLQKVHINFPLNSKPWYLFSHVICRICKLKCRSKNVSTEIWLGCRCWMFSVYQTVLSVVFKAF